MVKKKWIIININFINYFYFSLNEKVELNWLYIKKFIILGKLSYLNDENVNIFTTILCNFKLVMIILLIQYSFLILNQKKEIITLEIYSCNETCKKCEIHEICEEYIDGYYLFDSECFKILNDKNQVIYNSTTILQIYNLKINNYFQNTIDIFDESSKVKSSIINLKECTIN